MESRTAIVFGATGLVGSALTEELLRAELYVAMVRIMNSLTGKEIFESDKLQRIAGRK